MRPDQKHFRSGRLYHSTSRVAGSPVRIVATVDHDQRIALMEEADAIAAEDVPIIPIIHKVLSKVGSGRAHFEVNAAMAPILKEAWLEA